LELPPGGNGRSGREWVSAFATVVKRARNSNAAPAAAGALLSSALGALGQRMQNGSHADRSGAAVNGTPPSRAARAAVAALALIDGAQRAAASATTSGAATPTRQPGAVQHARGSPSPETRRVLRMDDEGSGKGPGSGGKGSGVSIAEDAEEEAQPRTPQPAVT
jgi:hypothetical protein